MGRTEGVCRNPIPYTTFVQHGIKDKPVDYPGQSDFCESSRSRMTTLRSSRPPPSWLRFIRLDPIGTVEPGAPSRVPHTHGAAPSYLWFDTPVCLSRCTCPSSANHPTVRPPRQLSRRRVFSLRDRKPRITEDADSAVTYYRTACCRYVHV